MDEEDFRDDELDELEVEDTRGGTRPLGKTAREKINKKVNQGNKSKTNKATETSKKSAKDKAINKTSDQVRKDTAKQIRNKAVKSTASTTAAAATGGTSKAAEIGVNTAIKLGNKLDEKLSAKIGVSEKKVKNVRRATVVFLPVIIILAIVIAFVSIFDFIQTEQTAKDVQKTIEDMEKEFGKDLLRFTDSDFKALLDQMEKSYKERGYPVTSFLGKLQNSYESDSEKTALEKALDAMGKYLRAEKYNFNKIKWVIINGENGEKKTPIMYETYDKLQLPKTDENYFGNGIFPAIQEDGTINKFKGYLQTWSIPFSMHMASNDAFFAQDVMDQMYHEVSAQAYLLNKYTKETTVNLTLETEGYQETYTCTDSNCPSGTSSHTHTRTAYRVKQPLTIKSVNTYSEGETIKTPDSVATFINYAETYKGILSSSVKLESKSSSTYQKTEGSVTVTGTPTASGVSGTRIDTETWKDLATQEEETVIGYEGVDKFKYDDLAVNRIEAFLINEKYGYTGRDLGLESLQSAFQVIDKYHKDILTSIKGGSEVVKDVWSGQGLAWPVPDAVTVGYYFEDPMYNTIFGKHTGIDISHEGKITNGHGPEVIAAADGKVKKVVNSKNPPRGYGNYVEIEHDNGLVTRYAHLFSIETNIREGYRISEGTKIGYMGVSGLDPSNGIHLHFEVIKDGVQVDPMDYYLYETKKMTFGGVYKTVYIYTGRKQANININTNNMQFTAEWNEKMNNMIEEALEMASLRCMVYNQGDRLIEIDTRPTSGDCSSFVANLYYRYFDHAYIGGNSVAQYDMMGLRNIKAIYVENAINPDGTINTAVVKPGDVIVNRTVHSMLYVGEIGGKGSGTIVDHGNGNGPKVNDFYYYSVQYRTSCKVIRYYRDDALINTGGPGLGGIELGGSVPSAAYDNAMRYFPIVQKWSKEFGLDPYVVIAMIAQESGGNPNSDNGAAVGLMQIEYVAGSQNQTCYYLDGRTEKISYSRAELFDPEKNIKTGCAQFRNRINEYNNNLLVAIQGYNYGPGGIARCIGYSMSGGANTNSVYCGYSMKQIKEYAATFDDKWLQARSWYTSTGWKYFGGGGGTKDHLERCLRYYDTRGGTEYPYVIDYATKNVIYFGKPGTNVGQSGDFPKYRQFEGPWSQISFTKSNIKGKSYTIAACGCGPSSTAIILSGLGVTVPGYDGVYYNGYQGQKDGKMDPAETAKFFIDNNCKDRGVDSSSGTNSDKFGAALKSACPQLDIAYVGNNANKAYDMIANQGYVAVANSNTQGSGSVHFTTGGHYIAIVGVENGRFIVIDPGSSKRDGSSCPGCGRGCGNVAYTPSMMSGLGSISKGGVRRWLMIKVK